MRRVIPWRVPGRPRPSYRVRPVPAIRRGYIDVLRAGQRQRTIHGLIEADIHDARALLARRPAADGWPLSFTGWVIACVALAVGEHPMLQAHRRGRNMVVLFDDVDVNVQLDQLLADGTRLVQSRIVTAANHKSAAQISAEIRQAQRSTDVDRRRYSATVAFAHLPRMLRAPLWRIVFNRPLLSKRLGGTIAVSSVGMFATGLGWGIPIAPVPLMVTIGGIGPRPVLRDGHLENRDHVSLTVSVDHDLVDGAPAAQFIDRLRGLLESAHGLEQVVPESPLDATHADRRTS